MLMNINEARQYWNADIWQNFKPEEFVCHCGCGEFWWDHRYFNALQAARVEYGKPIKLNCAHRCRRHNAKVGGAPKSEHKKIALDISLRGLTAADKKRLSRVLVKHGFVTRGAYRTFLHTDRRRPPRYWIAKGGKGNAKFFKRVVL